MDSVKVDPFAPQLLIDYTYFCDRFGPLPFGDFVAMWHAADALMQAAADVGYEPHEVPDLLITADNPRMAFIRATVACIRSDEQDVPSSTRICRLRRAFLGW